MAFSGMSSTSGRGRRRNSASMSEMNVVPLVDVVLVLLIIFMVTATAMEFGLGIQVPNVKQSSSSLEDAPVVSIGKTGTIYLKDRPVNINVLAAEVLRVAGKAKSVYVRADKNVRWDQLAQVVSTLGKSKLAVNMVTKAENIGK